MTLCSTACIPHTCGKHYVNTHTMYNSIIEHGMQWSVNSFGKHYVNTHTM